MKILLIIASTILASSFLLRYIHYPGHSVFFMLSILLLLIHNVIYLIKNVRVKPDCAIAFLTITAFSFYIFTRVYFWGSAQIVLTISMILLLIWLGLHSVRKATFSTLQIILVSSFIVVFATTFIHADRIFYILNAPYLRESTASENYELWDEYSWFLYQDGKFDEAKDANETALKGIQELLNKDQPLDIWRESEKQLLKRRDKIRTHSWNEFSLLPHL